MQYFDTQEGWICSPVCSSPAASKPSLLLNAVHLHALACRGCLPACAASLALIQVPKLQGRVRCAGCSLMSSISGNACFGQIPRATVGMPLWRFSRSLSVNWRHQSHKTEQGSGMGIEMRDILVIHHRGSIPLSVLHPGRRPLGSTLRVRHWAPPANESDHNSRPGTPSTQEIGNKYLLLSESTRSRNHTPLQRRGRSRIT